MSKSLPPTSGAGVRSLYPVSKSVSFKENPNVDPDILKLGRNPPGSVSVERVSTSDSRPQNLLNRSESGSPLSVELDSPLSVEPGSPLSVASLQSEPAPTHRNSSRSVEYNAITRQNDIEEELSGPQTFNDLSRTLNEYIQKHPDLAKFKHLALQVEKDAAQKALNNLRTKGKITQEQYGELMNDLNRKGLKLDNTGPSTIQKGLLNKTTEPNSLDAILKNATVEIDQSKIAQLMKTIEQKNNIGEKISLREKIMADTGREFGPDFALKVLAVKYTIIDDFVKDIINENSSITEVLNVLAFLLSKKQLERLGSIIDEFSIKSGAHNDLGDYINEKGITSNTGGDTSTLFASLNKAEEAPFDINTLTTYTPANQTPTPKGKLPSNIILPAGILKRDSTYTTKTVVLNNNHIKPLFVACVLQMVNILENTRQVFGGWAKLFKGMSGGKSKSKTNKTRRNNRRRY